MSILGSLVTLAAPLVGKGISKLFGKGESTGVGGFLAQNADALGSLIPGKSSPNYREIAQHQNDLAMQQMAYQGQLNRELASYTHQMNLEQIEKMNEYNSPAAQMQRLKEAGLNPNLVYGGSSGGTAGTQTQFAQYSESPVQAPALVSHEMLRLQNYQMDQMLRYREAQIEGLNLKNEKQKIENEVSDSTKELQKQYADLTNRILKKKGDLYQGLIELNSFKEVTEFRRAGQYQQNTIKMRAEIALIGAKVVSNKAEANYLNKLAAGQDIENDYLNKTLIDRVKMVSEALNKAKIDVKILREKLHNWEDYGQENSLISQIIRDSADNLTQEAFSFLFDLIEAYATGGTSLVKKIIYDSKGRVTGGSVTATGSPKNIPTKMNLNR